MGSSIRIGSRDYAAYFRHAKARFEQRVLGGSQALVTYPDPVDHCHVCVWYPTCITRRREDDHPSIVAGIRRVDTERFMSAGVPTLTQIAELPSEASVKDMGERARLRLSHQARLQLHERRTGERVYELITPEPEQTGHGLAALPEPTPWDVFFDIEADPWALDDGLEYLLGVAIEVDGEPTYLPFWGHDREEEKRAFEAFIDFCIDRLDAHPEMHVFHYGGYESGAVKRLMRRHATREDEVDRLLRGQVFVDLLNVVRQGVRASVESYSLKQIEKFYLAEREGPVTEAGFSVVEYERWMRERDDAILAVHRRLQPGRLHLDAHAARLARGAACRGGRRLPGAPTGAGPRSSPASRRSSRWRARPRCSAGWTSSSRDVPADKAQRIAGAAGPMAAGAAPGLASARRQARVVAVVRPARPVDRGPDRRERGDRRAHVRARPRTRTRRASCGATASRRRITSSSRATSRSTPSRATALGDGAGKIIDIDDIQGTIDLRVGPSRKPFHPRSLIPGKPIGGGSDAGRAAADRRPRHRARDGRAGAVPRRARPASPPSRRA